MSRAHLLVPVRTLGLAVLLLAGASCTHTADPSPAPLAARSRVPAVARTGTTEQQPAPNQDAMVDPKVIVAVQRALNDLGYAAGNSDGIVGPATRRAVLAFQRDHALPQDGHLTQALAQALQTLTVGAVLTVAEGDTLVYSDGSVEAVSAVRQIQWEQQVDARSLVAVRPSTASWPAAARAGLDWATTHALDLSGFNPPVEWSSTGVSEHFEIRTFPTLSPREASMVGAAAQSCRRFEMLSEESLRRYPGIACKEPKGGWYIARSRLRISSPASRLGTQAASGAVTPSSD
jgi:peptidoglycan hydrolase-like protein with peptidoglycan-binding domain